MASDLLGLTGLVLVLAGQPIAKLRWIALILALKLLDEFLR
jgi:hypothetical protein